MDRELQPGDIVRLAEKHRKYMLPLGVEGVGHVVDRMPNCYCKVQFRKGPVLLCHESWLVYQRPLFDPGDRVVICALDVHISEGTVREIRTSLTARYDMRIESDITSYDGTKGKVYSMCHEEDLCPIS